MLRNLGITNPEFRRHIWLEITAHRLVIGPVVCLATIIFFSLTSHNFWGVVNGSSLGIFVSMAVIWGGRNSYASMTSEVRGLTWDAQRMSSLGPWDLTWGKVFGSNVYMWYCAFFVIVAYIATIDSGTINEPVRAPVLGLLFAVLCQFAGLIFGLMYNSTKSDNKSARDTYGATAFLLVIIFVAFSMMPYIFRRPSDKVETVSWYFLYNIRAYDVLIFSTAAFLIWSVYGAYHFMRQELQYRTTYLPWFFFSIFVVLYAAGFSVNYNFAPGHGTWNTWINIAFGVLVFLMLVAMFVDRKDPVRYRALLRAVVARNFKALPGLIPCWATSLGLLFVMALIAEFFGEGGSLHRGYITMFFFALRDISLMLFLNFGKSPKKADAAALLYLFVLYGILPGIINLALGSGNLDALFLFWPWVNDSGIIFAVLEAVFTVSLLVMRWRRNYGSIEAAAAQD